VNPLTSITAPFSDLKVLGLQADEAACGHYRVRFPLEYLKRGGAEVEIRSDLNQTLLGKYDIILAQRQHDPNILDLLLQAKWMGKTIIYEIDDNVHRIHPTSCVFGVYKPGSETLHSIAKFMRNCDGLFTTSAVLGSQYAEYNQRVWVINNYIDYGYRDWETPITRDERLKDKVVIGWAGSITHQDDYAPLQGVLAKVLNKYDNVAFALVSAYMTMDIFVKELGLPEEKVVRLEPCDFPEFPKLPAQFDIGLVPLIDTGFNRAKSWLKPLEYGARGVPYIASALAPYISLHQETNGVGGYLCNTPQEWESALCRLVEDEAERKQRSAAILDTVRTHYSMEANAWRWAQAMRECRDMKIYQPQAERKIVVQEKPGRNEPCPCGSGKKYKKCHEGSWG
jgi:glycosyltransferase involved in cell wall biosynthesis